jgi:cobyric acid synthase
MSARLTGIAVLGVAAETGKTAACTGILRALAERGVPAEPFKAITVLDPADTAFAGRPVAERGIAHHCAAAGVPVGWWHNPVTVVPCGDAGTEGVLYLAGAERQVVPITGVDSVDTRQWPRGLRDDCLDATHQALAQLRDQGAPVVFEGAGAAGQLHPDGDLANDIALRAAGLPAAVVAMPARSGHVAALAGIGRIVSPEVGALLCGYVLTRVREPGMGLEVRQRLLIVPDLPHLATFPQAGPPEGFDGSAGSYREVYRRRADYVAESGLLGRLGLVADAPLPAPP